MRHFTHLHLHSEYSVVDSTLRIKDIIDLAKKDSMQAVAITDLHNMFGALKFYKSCLANHIKPIIGVDAYFCSRHAHIPKYRIILLAKNLAGYQEICKLLTRSYLSNASDPCIDEDWVFSKINTNIIALSGGIYGDISMLIQSGYFDQACDRALLWSSAFPDNGYYLELHRVFRAGIDDLLLQTVTLAGQTNVPVVATHPIQFAKIDDFVAHEVRVCIASGDRLEDTSRKVQFSEDQYFLTQAEACNLFDDIVVAIDNTQSIAEQCNFEITLGKIYFPSFDIPGDLTLDDYLKHLVNAGLVSRLSELGIDENDSEYDVYHDRINTELSIISQMGFAGYFLIVHDFIVWAKQNDISVGPGRGSGAGSLVAFALRITDVEPMRYGLLFERFLNPDRISMPDFDIDFCPLGRDLVIDYVKNKYGSSSVAQIVTFGTMASKAVIKDVGRALAIPYSVCDSISKLILNTPAKAYSLHEAYNTFFELKDRIDNADDDIKRLWDLSISLEDLPRNVGKHAAGLVIAPGDITNFCPIYLAEGTQTSQFDKDDIEEVGLIKFDFLGLRNLTIITDTLKSVKQLHGIELTLSNHRFDDIDTYKLLQSGNTIAVFQLESNGMRRVLTKLQPDNFEDVIAILALYRPGPLGSGMVDDFMARKAGSAAVDYFHEDLQSCLSTTYGIIVYQEQVMQISQIIGGYTLGNADLLRRAMGKKKSDEMAAHRALFTEGALKRGYNRALADKLFDLMAKFAEYGFNKSHSTAYAVISYRTAYLKAHYFTCFMASTMSSELYDTDKLHILYQDCLNNKISVLAPDINCSEYRFTAIDGNSIRYGLGAIKGIGEGTADAIVLERQKKLFISFEDFCLRIDRKVINKKTLESLVKAGVFDSLDNQQAKMFPGSSRAQLFAQIGPVMDYMKNIKQHEQQLSLFSDEEIMCSPVTINNATWSIKEELIHEREALGFYISANIFDAYKPVIKYDAFGITHLSQLQHTGKLKQSILVCGVITYMGSKLLKRGDKIHFIELDDSTATMEIVLFANKYDQYSHLLKLDNFICVQGDLMFDQFRNQLKIHVNSVYSIDELLKHKLSGVRILAGDNINLLDQAKSYINEFGSCDISIQYSGNSTDCEAILGQQHRLVVSYDNILHLYALFGQHSVVLS